MLREPNVKHADRMAMLTERRNLMDSRNYRDNIIMLEHINSRLQRVPNALQKSELLLRQGTLTENIAAFNK